MALKRKKPTAAQVAHAWFGEHNLVACLGIAVGIAAALVGLFLFVTMSGFGGSADFIYNQF